MRVGVRPFLAGLRSLILEYGDVFEARVALEIRDPQRIGFQHALDLLVAQLGKRSGVVARLDDDLVGADGGHAVIDSLGRARRVSFHVIERAEVRVGANLPLARAGQFQKRMRLDAVVRAERARIGARLLALRMTHHDPAPRDGVFTKLHCSPRKNARRLVYTGKSHGRSL